MRPTAMIHMGGSQAEGGAEDACEQGAQRDGAVVQELHGDDDAAEQVSGGVGLPEAAFDDVAADDAASHHVQPPGPWLVSGRSNANGAATSSLSSRARAVPNRRARAAALAAPITLPTLIPEMSRPTPPGLMPTSRTRNTTRMPDSRTYQHSAVCVSAEAHSKTWGEAVDIRGNGPRAG